MAMFSVDDVLMRLDEDSDDDFDGYLDDDSESVVSCPDPFRKNRVWARD